MTRRRSPSCHQEDTDPMDTAATPPQPADTEAIAGQQAHWASTFDANPDMYGTDPSVPALAAAEAFAAAGYHSVLELGAGQGRDSIDASYSHMLFCMALTTGELERLAGELFRVLRPGGLVVYTARTTADAHYGTGTPRGDDMYEHGGFIVHFFDQALIDHLAAGFELVDVTEFIEVDLPRRLARVTMRRP